MEPNHNQGRIELPANFEEVDIDHLVILIADMLERLISHNDRIPLSPCVQPVSPAGTVSAEARDSVVTEHSEALTRFHSKTPPSISVLDYLRRIVRFTKTEVRTSTLSALNLSLIFRSEDVSAHNAPLHRSDVHPLSAFHALLPDMPSLHLDIHCHRQQSLLRHLHYECGVRQSWRYTNSGTQLIGTGALD